MNGDKMISPFTRQLWALQLAAQGKHNVPVMFTVENIHTPPCGATMVNFFVAEGYSNTKACFDYLAYEFEAMQSIGKELTPNTLCNVYTYTGPVSYIERDDAEAAAKFVNDALNGISSASVGGSTAQSLLNKHTKGN